MSATAAVRRNAASGFYVTIVTAKGSTTKKVDGDLLTVGRAEDCNLSITHETLSRRHMSITLKDGQCFIEDHGSSNGTFINGKRLRPHEPRHVQPEDQIQLAQSGVKLSVSTEPISRPEGAPPLPEEEAEPQAKSTIVSTTSTQRHALRESVVAPMPKTVEKFHEEAETIVQDAMKKAATLLQEAELEAERRVEDIYRRAHETQAKMDEVYQRRMNEAYRAAEAVYQRSQTEAQSILDTARQRSAEIRLQAEGFVMDLRRRTEEDCERILEEAQQTARELKENRLLEAEEVIRKREEELIHNTKVSMSERMARFEEEMAQEATRRREALEDELNERRESLTEEQRELTETVSKLKTTLTFLEENKEDMEGRLSELNSSVDERSTLNKQLQNEIEANRKSLAESHQRLNDLRADVERSERLYGESQAKLKEIQTQVGRLQEESNSKTGRLHREEEEIEAKILRLREQFEQDRANLMKEEQRRQEDMKLETARRVHEIEKQMLEELAHKRERLSKELVLAIETFLKENPMPDPRSIRKLQDELLTMMETQISTMSRDPGAKGKERSLVALKRREKIRAALVGGVFGGLALWGGQIVYTKAMTKGSPMEMKVAEFQAERKKDLELRKFSPVQTDEYRETYVDNVIYCRGFVDIYLEDGFQKEFFKAVTPFLLKTWRVEEEKVIELLAVVNAMVKGLSEKKEAIHPDFVPQGLAKMKEAEAEAMVKMRQILGSQVRVESFKKFERQFFEKHRIQNAQ
ncbi:MAG: FHA domain-containing protein [Bdellovibrionales bacterium]